MQKLKKEGLIMALLSTKKGRKNKERKTKYLPKKMKIFKREKQKSPEYSFLLWRTR